MPLTSTRGHSLAEMAFTGRQRTAILCLLVLYDST